MTMPANKLTSEATKTTMPTEQIHNEAQHRQRHLRTMISDAQTVIGECVAELTHLECITQINPYPAVGAYPKIEEPDWGRTRVGKNYHE